MKDLPSLTITEFLLAALYFAAALSSSIWAGHAWYLGDEYRAMQGAGFALALLAGCADPKKYFVDCYTFPFELVRTSGRETPLTVIGALLGTAMALAGWLLERYAG